MLEESSGERADAEKPFHAAQPCMPPCPSPAEEAGRNLLLGTILLDKLLFEHKRVCCVYVCACVFGGGGTVPSMMSQKEGTSLRGRKSVAQNTYDTGSILRVLGTLLQMEHSNEGLSTGATAIWVEKVPPMLPATRM